MLSCHAACNRGSGRSRRGHWVTSPCARSKAWIEGFSSTHSRMAFVGGATQRPTISAALAVKFGSLLSHQDLRAARSILWLRRNRQTYWTSTSPSAPIANGAGAPEYWQLRAEEAREWAELMSGETAKQTMLSVAKDCDRFACLAAQRSIDELFVRDASSTRRRGADAPTMAVCWGRRPSQLCLQRRIV